MDSTPIQLMNDSESDGYILSQDNKTLSVSVPNSTDQRVFQCKLYLQQCSSYDPQRCQSLSVEGPLMEINVLGKLMTQLSININYFYLSFQREVK